MSDHRAGKPEAGPQASIFDIRQEGVWEDHLAANRDLAERLRQALSRAGIGRRDPLAPVITLLGEMLQRYTHLAADQIGACGRWWRTKLPHAVARSIRSPDC